MIIRLSTLVLGLFLMANQSGFSNPAFSSLDILPLTAVIVSPETESSFSEGSMITFKVEASNEGTEIDSIQIYDANGQLWATDQESPWSLPVMDLTPGDYEFYAVAYDAMSNTVNSASININVAANISPTVDITSPSDGQSFLDNQTITFGFAPTDSDGSVNKIELYSDSDEYIGQTNSAPWNLNIGTLVPGSYSFYARVSDNQLASGESEMVTIHILDHANVAPTVTIMSPENGANLTTEDDILFQIEANDEDGTVNVVELFDANGNKLGSAAQAPYNIDLGKLAAGSYSFYAQALDNGWSTGVSETINITVEEFVNTAPMVNLTNPTDGATIKINTPTTVIADATDDGSISLVRFYLDGQLVLSDTEAPFEYEWIPSTVGNYNWQAVATDNNGALGSSAMVSVDVTLSTGLEEIYTDAISIYPNPTKGIFQLELDETVQFDQAVLMELTGKIIHRQNITGVKNIAFDLQRFPEGIYFIQLSNALGIQISKIIKQ